MSGRIPFDQYAAIDAINWSLLKEGRRSMLHLRYRMAHPRKDTPALKQGRANHCAVFEPDEFPIRYVVIPRDFMKDPSLNRSTNAGKARFAEWLEAHPDDADLDADEYKGRVFASLNPGHEAITTENYRRALTTRDAVRAHPLVKPYLRFGLSEHTIEWTDRDTGFKLKGRVDWLTHSIVDLKGTSRGVEKRITASEIVRYGYNGQGAIYQDGIAATGERLPVVLIFVESEPPHDVSVCPLDEDVLRLGRQDYQSLLGTFAECKRTNNWPGCHQAEQVITLTDLPRWYLGTDDSFTGYEVIEENPNA